MKRVGMIGLGGIAQVHLTGWQRLPVELAAHYDIQPEAAQRASEKFGGMACATVEELLDQVDIVDICTPAVIHKENILAAAKAKKAIVCEKPMARRLRDCYEIVEACESAGVRLFIAHVVRFFPEFAKAKAVIDSGAIGKPGVIRTIRAGAYPKGKFFREFELSGGVVLDVNIHDIDYQRWVMGDVERVFARGLTFANKGCDHALITLRYTNGGVGHIEGGWASPPSQWRTRLEICGDEGMIEWDAEEEATVIDIRPNETATGKIRNKLSPLGPESNPYYLELAHFLDCLETGTPFRVTPRDALAAVKVALASIESMRTGRPIEIASFEEPAL